LRTRLQSDLYSGRPGHNPIQYKPRSLIGASLNNIRDAFQIVSSIRYKEGWRGFFRGLGPSLAGVVPATAVKFYVYGNFKTLGGRLLQCREDTAVIHAQAAIAAGIATATTTNPIWVVKTRLQLDASESGKNPRRYKNSWECTRQILRQEGIVGLYKGLSASYLGTVETMLHLVLYERLKTLYSTAFGIQQGSGQSEIANWISTSGAAASAKLAAGLIAYPHEAS
jgi:solute carrier family 25, member 33/36